MENTCFIPKDKGISLLELVVNNWVFSFQGKLSQQLQGDARDSPVYPVIPYIYMEYYEELALCLQCPTPWWKIYVDDVISVVKKEQIDTLFNHLNSVVLTSNSQWKLLAMTVASHSWIPNVLPVKAIPYIPLYTENHLTLIAT